MIAQDIIDDLRRHIVDGAYPDATRLPTREELTTRYGTSKATVQKALSTLEREGFIVSRGKLGTFVNPEAPHVNDIAIILPHRADRITEWNLLSQLLQLHSCELGRRFHKNFRYFYVDAEQHVKQDFEVIAREAECNRFSGVIFPLVPTDWMLEPFLAAHIPVAVLTEEKLTGCATVWLDYRGMIEQALDYFRERGCHRAAVLCDVRLPYYYVEEFVRLAEARGLEPRPEHIHALSTLDPYAVQWLPHHLAASLQTPERVDALLITDYAFLAPTLKHLRDLNLMPEQDIVLASHCNFPGPERNAWQAKLVGFNVFDVIGSCLEALELWRSGRFEAAKYPLIPSISC